MTDTRIPPFTATPQINESIEVVGNSIDNGLSASDVTAEMVDESSVEATGKPVGLSESDIKITFDAKANVRARRTQGGQAPEEVNRAVRDRRERLNTNEACVRQNIDFELAEKNLLVSVRSITGKYDKGHQKSRFTKVLNAAAIASSKYWSSSTNPHAWNHCRCVESSNPYFRVSQAGPDRIGETKQREVDERFLLSIRDLKHLSLNAIWYGVYVVLGGSQGFSPQRQVFRARFVLNQPAEIKEVQDIKTRYRYRQTKSPPL